MIILEQKLPKTTGLDFIKNLRRAEKGQIQQTAALLFSGYLTEQKIREAFSNGVRHVLTKPCPEEKFIAKIVDTLKKEKIKSIRDSA
ncbi:MAG: response regulator [Bacteriovoracaceae bacterium]